MEGTTIHGPRGCKSHYKPKIRLDSSKGRYLNWQKESYPEQWMTCNPILVSWIFNHLDKALKNSVAGVKNAKTL
ncbi:hypothetical protein CDL15_Pgr010513 [Punica granatum]|uniref:Uncharacterized protein n=1 Tax=Punica granatum TaxID=22663 RepID=A0A218XX54_PUNGR|nr:hypothetical protein CDL15_Pgr010513 [Punica granatum]